MGFAKTGVPRTDISLYPIQRRCPQFQLRPLRTTRRLASCWRQTTWVRQAQRVLREGLVLRVLREDRRERQVWVLRDRRERREHLGVLREQQVLRDLRGLLALWVLREPRVLRVRRDWRDRRVRRASWVRLDLRGFLESV